MYQNDKNITEKSPPEAPKIAQRLPKSTPRRPSCSQDGHLDLHLEPMLAYLGALGRHFAANITQLSAKTSQDYPISNHDRPEQLPRCVNHSIQQPPKTKKQLKTKRFSTFFDIQPMYQNDKKK